MTAAPFLQAIIDRSACEAAVQSRGNNFVGNTACSASDCAPLGCYIFPNAAGGGRFNSDKAGPCTTTRVCLCTAGAGAPPSPTPSMRPTLQPTAVSAVPTLAPTATPFNESSLTLPPTQFPSPTPTFTPSSPGPSPSPTPMPSPHPTVVAVDCTPQTVANDTLPVPMRLVGNECWLTAVVRQVLSMNGLIGAHAAKSAMQVRVSLA